LQSEEMKERERRREIEGRLVGEIERLEGEIREAEKEVKRRREEVEEIEEA